MIQGHRPVYPQSDTLNSWKEIARYLDRGVRTVQRWERNFHLPVRRPWGKKRSAVVAIRREIDAWLAASMPSAPFGAGIAGPSYRN